MKKVAFSLILAAGLFAACGATGPQADKMRREIRTGMTLPEVFSVTKEWLYCWGHSMSGSKEENVTVFPDGKSELTAEGSTVKFGNTEELSQALSKRMKETRVDWEFTFGFLATPRRVYFSVTIGPDGKVSHISEMKTRD